MRDRTVNRLCILGLAFALALFVDAVQAGQYKLTVISAVPKGYIFGSYVFDPIDINKVYYFDVQPKGDDLKPILGDWFSWPLIHPDGLRRIKAYEGDCAASNTNTIPLGDSNSFGLSSCDGIIVYNGAEYPDYVFDVSTITLNLIYEDTPPPEPVCPEDVNETFWVPSTPSFTMMTINGGTMPVQVCLSAEYLGSQDTTGYCLMKVEPDWFCARDDAEGCYKQYRNTYSKCDPADYDHTGANISFGSTPEDMNIDVVEGTEFSCQELPNDELCVSMMGTVGNDQTKECVYDSAGNPVACVDDPTTATDTTTGETKECPAESICGWLDHDQDPATAPVWGSVGGIDQTNCGSFNGTQVCVADDGSVVSEDSPDHPTNGGNLDGDDTNDWLDPSNPDDTISDGENTRILADRIEGAIQTQTDQLISAAEQLQTENQEFLETTFTEEVDADTGNYNANQTAIEGSVDESIAALDSKDDILNQAETGDGLAGDSRQYLNARGNAVEGLFDNIGSCQNYSVDFGDWTLTLECSTFDIARTVLAWAFWGMLVIYSYFTVTQAFKEASE